MVRNKSEMFLSSSFFIVRMTCACFFFFGRRFSRRSTRLKWKLNPRNSLELYAGTFDLNRKIPKHSDGIWSVRAVRSSRKLDWNKICLLAAGSETQGLSFALYWFLDNRILSFTLCLKYKNKFFFLHCIYFPRTGRMLWTAYWPGMYIYQSFNRVIRLLSYRFLQFHYKNNNEKYIVGK